MAKAKKKMIIARKSLIPLDGSRSRRWIETDFLLLELRLQRVILRLEVNRLRVNRLFDKKLDDDEVKLNKLKLKLKLKN